MNTPKDEMNEIAQLAKTFSTACKDAVQEGKVETRTTPVVKAALVLLTAGAATSLPWG